MEIRVTENNIIPFRRPEEKEIEVVSWVNLPNVLLRNAKATEYIETCKAKKAEREEKLETLGYFVSGALVFLMPFALCILASIF